MTEGGKLRERRLWNELYVREIMEGVSVVGKYREEDRRYGEERTKDGR